MAEPEPAWLKTARSYLGQDEVPGSASNPVILQMAAAIGAKYPRQRAYAATYTNDDIKWCGVFTGACLAINDVEPIFGATATDRWMWAQAWKQFGIALDQPRIGCIVVFARHVGFYVGEDGDYYLILGGNQSNTVKISRFAKSSAEALRWPATLSAQPAAPLITTELRRRMGKAILDAEARRDSQGHLAVYQLPAGDGGGTYEVAGINDRYHPTEAAALASMIRAGRYAEAEAYAIDFMVKYTDAVVGWNEDAGVEFYLRDTAFNRGPTGAARIFQRALGVDEDGEVGPITLAASSADVPTELLDALRAARESYERNPVGRDESSKFWRGLVNRWNNALETAHEFSRELPMVNPVTPPTAPALDMAKIQRIIDEMGKALAMINEVLPLLQALKNGAPLPTTSPPAELPDGEPPTTAPTSPPVSTGTMVARNTAGSLLTALGSFAAWYNGGITDTTAINTAIAGIAGGALSAYSPLIGIALNVGSRVIQGWRATRKQQ